VIPVYIGRGENGLFFVSSELKAFHDVATSIEIMLPGHYYDSELKEQIRWYFPKYQDIDYIPEEPVDFTKLRDLLIASVKRRLMTDVPFGVLLSGGLDSSLIAAITSRYYSEFVEKHVGEDVVISTKLHSFCIGLEDSPDLKASRVVANFLGTKHHEFTFTLQQGIDAISEVIYFTETFNPTTIRASTPMWLMARRIKSFGIKVVLTGEGSDEVFGGYLYFHKAPNKKEFHQETVRKLLDLYKYDLLRANKSTASWGIEARVPFLDKEFVEYAMSFDPNFKMITKDQQIEKWVLRKAFDIKENPFLPDDILWRQKEQFSDGVGYNWIDGLKVHLYNNIGLYRWSSQ
jgi:asparagine synthase (glutamine-hydrolysing)